MKSKLSFLSMILTICMLISALASCSSGKIESTETQSTVTSDTSSEVTTDTESSKVSSTETISETNNIHTSETDTEESNESSSTSSVESTEESNESSSTSSVESTEESSETDTEKAEISLGGDYGNSILYADELKNGVQAYYPDGVAREDFVVENLDITAEFSLTAGNDPMLTYLKNKEGGTYLENTMDVFVRMTDGKVHYASDSTVNARSNTYRIGYYYYDVRILNQNFLSDASIEKEIAIDSKLFANNYNRKSISTFAVKRGTIKYVVSGSDPYFNCNNGDIDIPFSEYDAIQFTIKSTRASQAQLFALTDEIQSFTADNSLTFDVDPDGEFHTYTVMLHELPNTSGSLKGFRLDLGIESGEIIEVRDIKAVDISSNAPYILLDRTWHTYSDKVHQELHFVAPAGQSGIDAVGMITEIPENKVAKLIVKAGGTTHSALDGINWDTVEYIAFDIIDAGIFGYVMPYDGKGGSLRVTLSDGVYTVIQEATPEGGEIKSPKAAGNTGNDFFMGQRIYTDESHDFASFIKEAEWERAPFKGIKSDNYVTYDTLRGAYLFDIGGTDFNSPFFTSQNKHYSVSIKLRNINEDRPIYIRLSTASGCLENAVLLDGDGMLIPIPLEVSKNFGEGEEPVMNYGDETYGETLFPFFITKGTRYEFTVLNLYQNWGKFPLKQLSSIAYYAPYYHLSIGVTETTCISPWYVRGRTLWTLPDFRSISAPYWFELPVGEGYSHQPQHTSANLYEIIHYTDSDGNFIASENYKNTIDSSGPIYANVKMDYKSDDGKMHISYDHLELPQTDELRTFYTVKIDVLEDISIKDFKNDFAFYSWVTDRTHVGYLDASGQVAEKERADRNGEYILGKESPYFGNFGTDEKNAANVGFVIHSSDITIGGAKFDGNFVVTQSNDTRFELSLDLGEATLKEGDKIILNIILVPWGSHNSTDASNLFYIRENTCISPFKTSVTDGELISDLYMPKVRSLNGESVEFTVSGGANNAAIRIYGFNKLTAPKIYEKIDGEWVLYDVSSVETPDRAGNRHYYDGYMTYYDGDGTYSYAFAFNMDGVESRTFKVEAKDDFKPWPDTEDLNSDPINYYTDPTELKFLFANPIPGVSSAEIFDDEGGFSYIRLVGDGKNVAEVCLNVLYSRDGVPSGKYIVLKYRMPSTNVSVNPLQFYISTENDKAVQGDAIALPTNKVYNDDKWHVIIVDAESYIPDSFKASSDGEYFAKYMRFDVFNRPLGETEYVDIAYVGVCDTIEKLCLLNSDMETMTLFSNGKEQTVDVATGDITSGSQNDPTKEPFVNEGVTMNKNFASFIDPNNTKNYHASSELYFGRIDALNGFGPAGIVGTAYNAKGSNSNDGVASFKYNNTTTSDYYLVFSGWSLVYGGVEKYVWSADGGKTWNDVELYNRTELKAASDGMLKYGNQAFGKSDFNLYAENSSYQGTLNGHDTCSGLGADLSAYVGETINVTFAAVPRTDPTGLCILAHVTGVKVEAPADDETDDETDDEPTNDS